MDKFDYAEYKGFTDPALDRKVLVGRNNKLLTAALFLERSNQWADVTEQRRQEGKWDHEPIYTLSETEQEGLPSAYQIYMHSVDEYEAAKKLFGSIFHWQELCKKKWFMEYVVQWREHMALRDFSVAKGTTLREALSGDGPAARHLLNFSNKVINPAPNKPKGKKEKEESDDAELESLYNRHLGDGPNSEAS